MLIETKFKIGDVVYLKTDIDQFKRIITGMIIRMNAIIYILSFETTESNHYDFEFTNEIDIVMKTTN